MRPDSTLRPQAISDYKRILRPARRPIVDIAVLYPTTQMMLEMTGSVVRGFTVDGFGPALLGALLLSVVSFALNVFVNDRGRFGHIHVEYRRF